MPYRSERQRRFFNANRAELESQGVDVDEWNQSSKGKKLPEHKDDKMDKRADDGMSLTDAGMMAGATFGGQHYGGRLGGSIATQHMFQNPHTISSPWDFVRKPLKGKLIGKGVGGTLGMLALPLIARLFGGSKKVHPDQISPAGEALYQKIRAQVAKDVRAQAAKGLAQPTGTPDMTPANALGQLAGKQAAMDKRADDLSLTDIAAMGGAAYGGQRLGAGPGEQLGRAAGKLWASETRPSTAALRNQAYREIIPPDRGGLSNDDWYRPKHPGKSLLPGPGHSGPSHLMVDPDALRPGSHSGGGVAGRGDLNTATLKQVRNAPKGIMEYLRGLRSAAVAKGGRLGKMTGRVGGGLAGAAILPLIAALLSGKQQAQATETPDMTPANELGQLAGKQAAWGQAMGQGLRAAQKAMGPGSALGPARPAPKPAGAQAKPAPGGWGPWGAASRMAGRALGGYQPGMMQAKSQQATKPAAKPAPARPAGFRDAAPHGADPSQIHIGNMSFPRGTPAAGGISRMAGRALGGYQPGMMQAASRQATKPAAKPAPARPSNFQDAAPQGSGFKPGLSGANIPKPQGSVFGAAPGFGKRSNTDALGEVLGAGAETLASGAAGAGVGGVLGGAATGGMLGAGAGAISGLADPGKDEEGNKRSRIMQALKRALGYGAGGAAIGGLAIPGGIAGGIYGGAMGADAGARASGLSDKLQALDGKQANYSLSGATPMRKAAHTVAIQAMSQYIEGLANKFPAGTQAVKVAANLKATRKLLKLAATLKEQGDLFKAVGLVYHDKSAAYRHQVTQGLLKGFNKRLKQAASMGVSGHPSAGVTPTKATGTTSVPTVGSTSQTVTV